MALTVISDFENTEESTTSTSYVDTNCETAALSNTVEYLVMYSASVGNSASEFTEMQVLFGSTTIAETRSKCSSSGGVNHGRGRSTCGYFIVTGNGTSTLKIQFQRGSGTGTAYIGGMALVAIPLDELTEDTDYYQTTQNGDPSELTLNNTTGTLLTLTKSTGSGDHIVLASCECSPDDQSTGFDAASMWVDIDGTDQKQNAVFQNTTTYTVDQDYMPWCYARVHNLTEASHTFKIECESHNGTDSNWRRGRIIVIDTSVFDQVANTSDDTEDTVGVNYSTFEDDLTLAYTPNQNEDVVVITNLINVHKQNFRSTYLYLTDDTTDWCKYTGNDGPISGVLDTSGVGLISTASITGATTYKVKRTDENNTTHNTTNYSDIIVISMELAGGGGAVTTAAVSAIIG